MSSDAAPQSHSDAPPPFSFEQFKAQIMPMMLQAFDGAAGEYLRSLRGSEGEFLTRVLYLATVAKWQHPDMTPSQFMYAFSYGFARHSLDRGRSPDSARAELSQVPWDTLPGLSEYDRETANAVAVRAFDDALAGHPQMPLH